MVQHAILAESGALASLDVEAVLSRLPARTRADILWVRPVIEKLLRRLQEEPLTDELVVEVTGEALKPLQTLGLSFWQAFAPSPEAWRAEVAQALRRDGELLDQFLTDEDRLESLVWAKGLLASFFDELLRRAGQMDPAVVDEIADDEAMPEGARCLISAQVALMAALDLAKMQRDAERAGDLIDVAFLDLVKFKEALARDGILLTAFPNETPAERAERVIRYAELARAIMTDEDMKVFDEARLRTLR